jgi:hypothetical protein
MSRQGGRHSLAGPEPEDLAHHAAHDATLAELGQFRVESPFTTSSHKFVLFEVSSKLGGISGGDPSSRSTARPRISVREDFLDNRSTTVMSVDGVSPT